MPSLVHFTLDPFSRRLRLALAEYGVPVDLIDEEPWEPMPEIFDINPAGTPSRLPRGFGNAPSAASRPSANIWRRPSPARIRLIPGDVLERAEVRRLTGWFDAKFYAEVSEPMLTEKVIRRFLERDKGGGGPDTQRVRQAMARLREHLDYIGHLADHRTWLAGDELSLADLAAAAHLSTVDYLGDVPWTEFPVAKSWYQRVKSRPSFRPLLADTVRGMAPCAHYADLDF